MITHKPQQHALEVWVVIVTFKRLQSLRKVVESLQSQDFDLNVIVVDNANDEKVRDLCSTNAIHYLALETNQGPAGGRAAGMSFFIARSSSDAFLVFVDDDRPPESSSLIRRIATATAEQRGLDPQVAAVGLAGALMSKTEWRLRLHPARYDKNRPVDSFYDVDYLATGHFPCFARAAIVQVGVLDRELFFGSTEVEYGLRLRAARLRLLEYSISDLPDAPSDRDEGSSRLLYPGRANWRHYYQVRNGIVIARRYSGTWVAVRISVFRYSAKLAVNLLIRPRVALGYIGPTVRGIVDGWLGRMGCQVDPWLWTIKHSPATEEMPNT